jgi:hypothetical protein
MKRFAAYSDPRLAGTRIALALGLVCLLIGLERSPALAASEPAREPATITLVGQRSADPQPVPPPATSYALDRSQLGRLLEVSEQWSQAALDNTVDGSFHRGQYQTSGSGPDAALVESQVYVLSSAAQARKLYESLQDQKKAETGADASSESGWQANRASGYYQTRSDESVAVIILLFRNAVGLVEIRGSGQYADRASRVRARALMRTVLQAFQDAAVAREAAPRPVSAQQGGAVQ